MKLSKVFFLFVCFFERFCGNFMGNMQRLWYMVVVNSQCTLEAKYHLNERYGKKRETIYYSFSMSTCFFLGCHFLAFGFAYDSMCQRCWKGKPCILQSHSWSLLLNIWPRKKKALPYFLLLLLIAVLFSFFAPVYIFRGLNVATLAYVMCKWCLFMLQSKNCFTGANNCIFAICLDIVYVQCFVDVICFMIFFSFLSFYFFLFFFHFVIVALVFIKCFLLKDCIKSWWSDRWIYASYI